MMRRAGRTVPALALSLCGAWIAVAAQTQTPQRPPVFRAGAVLVTVDAYPQRDGRLVEGLTPADFQILEDGKPQTIEGVEFVRVEPGLSESERRDPNNDREAWELAADPHNRVFVVYLDAPHVTVDGSHNIRRPLVDTLNRLIAPNDLFGVMTPNLQPRHLTLGRRLQSVEDQLTRYWPWGERHRLGRDPADPMEDYLWGCFSMKPPPRFGPWEVEDEGIIRTLDQVLIDRRREDRTLTSLEDLIAHLALRREARTVLMLITDGWLLYGPNQRLAEEVAKAPQAAPGVTIDQGGRLGLGKATTGTVDQSACNHELMRLTALDNPRRARDLLAQANRANVSIYPVTPAGLGASDTPISERQTPADRNTSLVLRDITRVRNRVEGLRTLAENTDGLAIVNTNDLAAGMRRIVDDVSAYYLLTYYSTNTKHDGRYRKIEVKMKPPGLQIKARRGYMAPAENAVAAGRSGAAPAPTVSAPPAGPSAVDTAFGVLARLRPSAESFTSGVAAADELAVAVELASSQLSGGRWAQGADVRVVATTTAGAAVGEGQGRIEPATRGALVRIPLPAGATGPWRVTATIGTGADRIDDRAEIRAGDGKLIGDALVFRGTPAASSPLRAVADFQYRRTERVHIEWAVRAPLDRREARLLGRNGQPLAVPVALTERDAGGRGVIAADLNLAPLSAGDYVIELVAGSGTDTERKYVAIRIL